MSAPDAGRNEIIEECALELERAAIRERDAIVDRACPPAMRARVEEGNRRDAYAFQVAAVILRRMKRCPHCGERI